MATIGTLQRLSAASLSQTLLEAQERATSGDPTIAIIDVRDDGMYLPYLNHSFTTYLLPSLHKPHHPSNPQPNQPTPPQVPNQKPPTHPKPQTRNPNPNPKLTNPPSPPLTPHQTDYIGGHIKGSLNIPSRTLDAMLPTLVRQLQDKQTVVFHCALSQQRGPAAALRYLRERERIAGEGGKDGVVEQKVFVLDRGFVGWQEVYGEDERLTEGYRKELWEDGYWG